ncbi:hypothetical protein BC833DRAFT_589487 [Globomyces pollinis-pini]|nr:hypothetical protein BC833DRAFT_589487 [Globomyces pollinis-pini]
MLQFIVFLVSLVHAFSFDNSPSVATARFHQINEIKTNNPFKISFDLRFPFIAKQTKIHWLSINTPGPRPDSFDYELFLADTKGNTIRQLEYTRVPAVDGPNNWKHRFYLPSYVIPKGKTSAEFTFKVEFVNVDSLMAWMFKQKPTSLSQPFTISKGTATNITDAMFLNHGDQKGGLTVSLTEGVRDSGEVYLTETQFQDGSISRSIYTP